MKSERWRSCTEIFSAALERPHNARAAFLERSCNGDDVLRRKVELLLKYHDTSGDFIKSPAFEVALELLAADPQALIGQHLGCYRVDAVAGMGGMGVVYLACDERLGRKTALKLLPQSMVANEAELQRLKREARTTSALNHPNIVTIHEIGEADSTHYVATEFIEGATLRERMTKGPIRPDEALDIAAQVASALVAAHDAGIIHRDIKPENIMLRPDGYVKVLDFGIAKLAESAFADPAFAAASAEQAATADRAGSMTLAQTNLGLILGTTRYMSPEQACGAQVNKRTDIWSLGVVLYEMLTGHAPFTGNTPQDVMSSILETEPASLTKYVARPPAELQQIISKTLRKDREERYRSAHELLEALKNLRRKLETELERAAAPLWLRWARSPAAVVLGLLVAALAVTLSFYQPRNVTTSSPSAKSIAVLPLANLSDDKENAFFADGIHDELLSNLSRIKDLKVISRTSVMKYQSGNPRNLREIGQQLGVAHVLEGSVQRSANRVKVSAQLIDARTDAHMWSQIYDRDLTDVFAIQSEIATAIADQLQAKLSPAEKAAITERPTADAVAYALYTEALAAMYDTSHWEGVDKSFNRAAELLEKATQRDPTFALAYCELTRAHGALYSATAHPKPLELARNAAETAARLRPDLGETHLALARYYFYAGFSPTGGVDAASFDRAREELAIARRKLPNNADAFFVTGRIDRRQNRWDSALANFQKASELDPRHGGCVTYLAGTYFELRRYHDLGQLIRKWAANGTLNGPGIKLWLAKLKLAQGDPVAAQSLLEQVPLDFSPNGVIWQVRFDAALYLRDYDTAARVIAATPAKWADGALEGQHPVSWADGLVARARGDEETSLAVFAAARNKLDATWGDKPKDEGYLQLAARFDAGLGRKDDAIREALRAVELVPISKDSITGPGLVSHLALVYAWTDERDHALQQLEKVATIPAGPTYGDLLLNPRWDSLRGDPRFDKIVAAAKAASK
jgi:serine/threonine protein kinase/Tfp pilus assembly protein PilF